MASHPVSNSGLLVFVAMIPCSAMLGLLLYGRWKWLVGLVGLVAIVYLAGGFQSRDARYATRIAQAGKITRERQFDGVVTELARQFVAERRKRDTKLEAAAVEAVRAGCGDPFVRYIVFRKRIDSIYPRADVAASDELALEGCALLQEICSLPYPDGFRALAAYRALGCVLCTSKGRKLNAFAGQLQGIAWGGALAAIRDKSTPDDVMWSLAVRTEDYFGTDAKWRKTSEDALDPVLAARSGTEAFRHYLQGARAVQRAWEARGTGFANEVKPEGWAGFRAALVEARRELESAWTKGFQHIWVAEKMITVCLGEGAPRDEMEQWFARGLATGYDADDLCSAKAWYLDERWHGSLEERLRFGRECLAHPEWGRRAVLALWTAHRDHRSLCKLPESYFGRPEVWRDLKDSYSVFLAVNPNAEADRVFYVYLAWIAKDWAVVREELPRADPRTTTEEHLFGPTGIKRVQEDLAKASGT